MDRADKHVEAVIAKHRHRAEHGLRKYGVTTERQDLGDLQWLTHLQEELMDGAIYIEVIKCQLATAKADAAEIAALKGLSIAVLRDVKDVLVSHAEYDGAMTIKQWIDAAEKEARR